MISDLFKDLLAVVPAIVFLIGGVWSIAAIRNTTDAATSSINDLKNVLIDLKEWIRRVEDTTVEHGERLIRLETFREMNKHRKENT